MATPQLVAEVSPAMKVGAFVIGFGAVLSLFAGDHRISVPDTMAELGQLKANAA